MIYFFFICKSKKKSSPIGLVSIFFLTASYPHLFCNSVSPLPKPGSIHKGKETIFEEECLRREKLESLALAMIFDEEGVLED